MTVYEGEDRPDRYGNHPLRFKGYKSIEEVYEWLFDHYQGYHFVIILDVTRSEYEPMGRELAVYFSDTVLEEIAGMNGFEVRRR